MGNRNGCGQLGGVGPAAEEPLAGKKAFVAGACNAHGKGLGEIPEKIVVERAARGQEVPMVGPANCCATRYGRSRIPRGVGTMRVERAMLAVSPTGAWQAGGNAGLPALCCVGLVDGRPAPEGYTTSHIA